MKTEIRNSIIFLVLGILAFVALFLIGEDWAIYIFLSGFFLLIISSYFFKRAKGASKLLSTVFGVLSVFALILFLLLALIFIGNREHPKSPDARILYDLVAFRADAEFYYSNKQNSYGFSTNSCTGINTLFTDESLARYLIEAEKTSGNKATCFVSDQTPNSSSSYAISVPLKSDASKSWCVDSTGASKAITTDGSIVLTACQ